MLPRIADDYGFKIRTVQHVLEGYKVAHGAGASTFSDWWSYKVEAFDAIPYNAAIMQKKGVLVSLNSDDAELMRHLNSEAGKAVKYGGIGETEALAMVTLNPRAGVLNFLSRAAASQSSRCGWPLPDETGQRPERNTEIARRLGFS